VPKGQGGGGRFGTQGTGALSREEKTQRAVNALAGHKRMPERSAPLVQTVTTKR
jgi:hypothetical protein